MDTNNDNSEKTAPTDRRTEFLESEMKRIAALEPLQLLVEWGKRKYRDDFISVSGVCDDYEMRINHRGGDGGLSIDWHKTPHLVDEYAIWLAEHTDSDCNILTDDELVKGMIGKSMGEVSDERDKRLSTVSESIKDMMDDENRGRMLTVRKLMDYLSKQNPDACIMGFEPNSFGYIEQFGELPSLAIRTVAEDREEHRKFCMGQWYRGMDDAEERTEKEVSEMYRYCKDDDIIIRF